MFKNQYKLNNIILLESHFRREPDIKINDHIKDVININVEHRQDNRILFVILTMNFELKDKEKVYIEAKIAMLGIFEIPEEPVLPEEDFAKINAPAIIFPFVREHLANVSIKAGLQPILIQPINFVKLASDKN